MEIQMQILLEKIQIQMEKQTVIITETVTQNIMQQMGEKFKKLEDQNKQIYAEVSELKRKIRGLEIEKKMNNVLLFGLKEGSEDGFNLVKFMRDKINSHLALNIQEHEIDKIYRIGNNKSIGSRPILIKFTTNWRRNEVLKNKNKFPQGMYIKEDFTKETLEMRKSLQPRVEEERNKGNIAYLRGDKLIVKKQTDLNREKRKREASSSPTSKANTQNYPPLAGPKKVAAKNAFDILFRPRSNSLKEKSTS